MTNKKQSKHVKRIRNGRFLRNCTAKILRSLRPGVPKLGYMYP